MMYHTGQDSATGVRGHWALVIGHWAWVIGQGGIGQGALVIGDWSGSSGHWGIGQGGMVRGLLGIGQGALRRIGVLTCPVRVERQVCAQAARRSKRAPLCLAYRTRRVRTPILRSGEPEFAEGTEIVSETGGIGHWSGVIGHWAGGYVGPIY
jgi:hypothetical protein